MARFDLYQLPRGHGYVVDVQSDHLSSKLCTRVVVPPIPLAALVAPIANLNPIVVFDGEQYVFVAQSLATLTLRELGKPIKSLTAEHGDALAYALDVLLTGF